jgi:hypothetical protein
MMSTLPIPLIFDLDGPFAVRLWKDQSGQPWASIYAARCDGHFATIVTDTGDDPLNGLPPLTADDLLKNVQYAPGDSFQYELTGPAPNGNPNYQYDKQLVIVDWNEKRCPTPEECHFVLTAPCPDQIFPLHCEQNWIYTADGPHADYEDANGYITSDRARSLRFFYHDCPNPPKVNPTKTQIWGKNSMIPRPRKFDPSCRTGLSQSHYSITLRYNAYGSQDRGQDDAYRCFWELRQLFKNDNRRGLDRWRVDFDNLNPPGGLWLEQIGGPHPHDCKALSVVLREFPLINR